MRISVTAGTAGSVSVAPRAPRGWSGSGSPSSSLGFPGDWYERTNGDYYRRTSAGWGSPLFNRFFAVRAVIGPASAVVDGHIPVWDTTSGQLLRSSGKALPSGAIVGTTDTQTFSNKSLAADPTSAMHPATKQYVDAKAVDVAAGITWRGSVRAATTGNITIATALNNGDSVDGVTLATGDLVLVKSQSAPAQNGVYVVGTTPARATVFDAWDDFPGAEIAVEEGTANADTRWQCTANRGGTLGTTAITWAQTHGASVTALAGLSLIADRLPYANGTGTLTLTPFSAIGRSVIGAADAAAVRTAIGAASSTSQTFAGNINVGSSAGSGDAALQIGDGRGASGNAFIDLVGDTTYTDYGLRIARFSGENGVSSIIHRGTGDMQISKQDGGLFKVRISSVDHTIFAADGSVQMGAGASVVISASRHHQLRSYTVATLPSAATAGQLIYVSDGTSNKRLAVSDGTNWRFPDGNVVT